MYVHTVHPYCMHTLTVRLGLFTLAEMVLSRNKMFGGEDDKGEVQPM